MNIGEWVSKRALLHPEKLFLREEDGREFKNDEFDRRVNRMAHALSELGIVKGQRVAALMLNSSEFLEIFFACGKTGAIMVPVNFRLAVPELRALLPAAHEDEDARPRPRLHRGVGERLARPGAVRIPGSGSRLLHGDPIPPDRGRDDVLQPREVDVVRVARLDQIRDP